MRLEPVTCEACGTLMTWVSDELKPIRPRSVYVTYQAKVHCATCDSDSITPYRTNKRPAQNLPPPGAHFFNRWVGLHCLPYYDPKLAVKAPVKAPPVETCESFGYKCAWYAVPDTDPAALAKELLVTPKRATWRAGVAAGYRGSIFVTPRIGEWTFVVSTSFFAGAELLPRLGKEAQYFASDRVIGLNIAVRGTKRMTVGDEEKLMKQAGKWGMNPQVLGSTPSGGALGWLAAALRRSKR